MFVLPEVCTPVAYPRYFLGSKQKKNFFLFGVEQMFLQKILESKNVKATLMQVLWHPLWHHLWHPQLVTLLKKLESQAKGYKKLF